MKTSILIATDFNPESAACLSALCGKFRGQKIRIVFAHFFKLSDDIDELLMLSRRSREFEYIPDQFYIECEAQKRKCNAIESIQIEFFYGSTLATFRNFLETHDIDCILNPNDCFCQPVHHSSLKPETFFSRVALPVVSARPLPASLPLAELSPKQTELV